MSWREYTDMFDRAQVASVREAPYRMLIVDVAGSRKTDPPYDPRELSSLVDAAARLLEDDGVLFAPGEGELSDPRCATLYVDDGARQDLLDDDDRGESRARRFFFGGGDCRGVVIDEKTLRERLGIASGKALSDEDEETLDAYLRDVIDSAARELGVRFGLHMSHGRFETLSWADGCDGYAFAYCIPQLEALSKRGERS